MKTFYLSDIIQKQPIINVGCIGHVSHGKSTIVGKFTGKKTQKHSNEIQRGITILLGYANLKIYYNKALHQFRYSSKDVIEEGYKLVNHLSFVDCPGHHALMSTMISGSKVFDAAILLIAANDLIPQVQTLKHAEVLKYSNIQDLVVVFNKIDLLTSDAMVDEKVDQLMHFLKNHEQLQDKSVIPMSAEKGYNLENLLVFLCNKHKQISHIQKRIKDKFKMCVLRSFDINPKGVSLENLCGGVIGGSILSGHLKIGDSVGIFPGHISKNNNQWIINPLFSTVQTLQSEENRLEICFPGGLVAIGLGCDPSLCKQNNLLGSVIFKLDKDNYSEFLEEDNYSHDFMMDIDYILEDLGQPINDVVLIINSRAIKGIFEKMDDSGAKIVLQQPIFLDKTEKIPILINSEKTIEVLGIGRIKHGNKKIKIHLPSDFSSFAENLKDNDQEISIVNDIDEICFDEDHFSSGHLRDNIKSFLIENISNKIKFPKLQIVYEPNKIVWNNFQNFIELCQNIEKNIDTSSFKILSLSKTIIPYIAFSYGIDDLNNLYIMQDSLFVLLKTKKLKNKLEKIIQTYFKDNHYCDKCRQISRTVCKIGHAIFKICLNCGDRISVTDPWLTNIK